jgi:antitoxin (DNA-binding transcriptional repressor) of toxin-antitoxin stability system
MWRDAMSRTITATEAVRHFSDLLNTIKFKGSQFTIVRGGKPVASLGPADVPAHGRTLGELKELMKKIPRLGEETEAFEGDLKAAAKKQPGLPKRHVWA